MGNAATVSNLRGILIRVMRNFSHWIPALKAVCFRTFILCIFRVSKDQFVRKKKVVTNGYQRT